LGFSKFSFFTKWIGILILIVPKLKSGPLCLQRGLPLNHRAKRKGPYLSLSSSEALTIMDLILGPLWAKRKDEDHNIYAKGPKGPIGSHKYLAV